MSNATEQYPDVLSLADLVQEGVPVYPAEVPDQQVMARNLSLALVVVGPAHVESFIHPAATAPERLCMLEAIHEAVHHPAAFDGAWEPDRDGGWLLWLGVERDHPA